jgi:hypothetical protein
LLNDLAEAPVVLNIDPTDYGILFGIIGESATQRWWCKFTDRFGTIVWKTRAGENGPDERDGVLASMLRDSPVDAVLVETGIDYAGVARFGRARR